MIRHFGRKDVAVLAGCLLVISGCTSGAVQQTSHGDVGPVRLTSFHDCGDELAALRSAAEASVGPYGLPTVAGSADSTAYPLAAGGVFPPAGARMDAPAAGAAAEPAGSAAAASGAASTATPAYSGTNDYVAGVDEPDLVKTDGRRIVTVSGGLLQVIDAASRTVTGRLNLSATGDGISFQPTNLLLDGDHALVFGTGGSAVSDSGGAANGSAQGVADGIAQPVSGARLLLVDLAGQPSVLSSYSIEGAMLDARQVGSTVRVVVSSQPRLNFTAPTAPTAGSGAGSGAAGSGSAGPGAATDAQRVTANEAVISQASLDDWLPHYAETSGGVTTTGRVSCADVSAASTFSGANLISVLTFDLGASTLGSGDAVTVVADGDTVYSTATSLYVAGDERWLTEAPIARTGATMSGSTGTGQQRTEIYRFDTTQPGPPKFVAGGTVPGYLLNQYSLSEWQGYLRVATTTGTSWALADGEPAGAQTSSSAVYVLSTTGPVMRLAGQVDGLGATERIYSVRFMGSVGYVVTFRQTDPLYTVDLSDPAHPRVRGSVALTGYSAYLHPASDTRLIGIGRAADAMGHVGGTQVSLFDVSDLAAPARLATFALAGAVSNAEFDPHAFLYWPGSHLVVVPVQMSGPVSAQPGTALGTPYQPQSGALVLRIDDSGITEAGFIKQPATATSYVGSPSIERSLIIGQTLWTISSTGAMASNLTTLRPLTWVNFSTGGA